MRSFKFILHLIVFFLGAVFTWFINSRLFDSVKPFKLENLLCMCVRDELEWEEIAECINWRENKEQEGQAHLP